MKSFTLFFLAGSVAGAIFGMHQSGLSDLFLAGQDLQPEQLLVLGKPTLVGGMISGCLRVIVDAFILAMLKA